MDPNFKTGTPSALQIYVKTLSFIAKYLYSKVGVGGEDLKNAGRLMLELFVNVNKVADEFYEVP